MHPKQRATTDRLRERMLKMLALANNAGATEGEADTARRMLDSLMAKHGISLGELTGEQPPEWLAITCADKADVRLVFAVLRRVLTANTIRYRQMRKAISVLMTPAQHIEAQVMLSVYRPALKRHMESALLAFIFRNKIEPDVPSEKDEEAAPAAKKPEPSIDVAAIRAMMAVTTPTQVHKQLANGT